MTIKVFTGNKAVTLARLTNRAVDVITTGGWLSTTDARLIAGTLRTTPESIRLRIDTRVLIEAITGRSLDPEANLASVIPLLLAGQLNQSQRDALTTIQEAL